VNVQFEASFEKDLRRVKNHKKLLEQVRLTIEQMKAAPDPTAVAKLTRLKGYDSFYRIRLGNYRIGLEITGETAIFVRILHRRDIYRYFP